MQKVEKSMYSQSNRKNTGIVFFISHHKAKLQIETRLSVQSYYNGVYQGCTSKNKCSGKGVFWWDSGEIYFGKLLQGSRLYFLKKYINR